MRFCNKTKEIIETSYLTTTVDEIVDMIDKSGLLKRKRLAIQTYVNKLIERDTLRKMNREKFAKRALADPIAYRATTLLSGAKTRAEKKGIPFDLTKDWLIAKLREGQCEATGIQFFIKPYSSKEEYDKVHPFSPSLDQIRPSEGYTKANVQVVCDQYNKLKGDRHETWAFRLAEKLVDSHRRKHSLRVKQTV